MSKTNCKTFPNCKCTFQGTIQKDGDNRRCSLSKSIIFGVPTFPSSWVTCTPSAGKGNIGDNCSCTYQGMWGADGLCDVQNKGDTLPTCTNCCNDA